MRITKEDYEALLNSVEIDPDDYGRILNIIQGYYCKLALVENFSPSLRHEYGRKADTIYNDLVARGFYENQYAKEN